MAPPLAQPGLSKPVMVPNPFSDLDWDPDEEQPRY